MQYLQGENLVYIALQKKKKKKLGKNILKNNLSS